MGNEESGTDLRKAGKGLLWRLAQWCDCHQATEGELWSGVDHFRQDCQLCRADSRPLPVRIRADRD